MNRSEAEGFTRRTYQRWERWMDRARGGGDRCEGWREKGGRQ